MGKVLSSPAPPGRWVTLREHTRVISRECRSFGPVDFLINNAGVYEFRPIALIDEEHIDRQFRINVKGLLFAT